MTENKRLLKDEEIRVAWDSEMMSDEYDDARRAVAKAQDQKTTEQIYKEIGEWLLNKYKAGWMAHGYPEDKICPEPEVFDLTFYGDDLARLKQGLPPEESKQFEENKNKRQRG